MTERLKEAVDGKLCGAVHRCPGDSHFASYTGDYDDPTLSSLEVVHGNSGQPDVAGCGALEE